MKRCVSDAWLPTVIIGGTTFAFSWLGPIVDKMIASGGLPAGMRLPAGFWTPPWWAATLVMLEVVDLTATLYDEARERWAGVIVEGVPSLLPHVPRTIPERIVSIVAGVLGASAAHWCMTGRPW